MWEGNGVRTFVTLLLLVVAMFSFGAGCSQSLVASRGYAVDAEPGEEQSYASPKAREEAAQSAKVFAVIFVFSFTIGFIMMMTTPQPDYQNMKTLGPPDPRTRPPEDDYPF